MMTGAKIILDIEMAAARDALAGLAGVGWMMSLPRRQAAYGGHPAGRGRADPPVGRAGLIAVTFGKMAVLARDRVVLPVSWESVMPGDEFTVQLEGSITLAPTVRQGHSALTLAGVCQAPPGALNSDDGERMRPELVEAAREFIASVARDVTGAAGPGPGPGQDPPGPAWAW